MSEHKNKCVRPIGAVEFGGVMCGKGRGDVGEKGMEDGKKRRGGTRWKGMEVVKRGRRGGTRGQGMEDVRGRSECTRRKDGRCERRGKGRRGTIWKGMEVKRSKRMH